MTTTISGRPNPKPEPSPVLPALDPGECVVLLNTLHLRKSSELLKKP